MGRQPLLLVHGFASNRSIWDPVLPHLDGAHEFEVPDLPGFGAERCLDVTPTPAALVDWLEQRLDERGWETAHVAGHSMGALLSLELARRGRARTVTALTPSGPASSRAMARAKRLLRLQRRVGRAIAPVLEPLIRSRVTRPLVLGVSSAHPNRQPAAWWMTQQEHYLRCPGFHEVLDELDPNTLAEGFGSIDVPVTLAYGDRDLIVPATASHAYRRLLPSHARFVLFRDTGHTITGEEPELSAATILATTGVT